MFMYEFFPSNPRGSWHNPRGSWHKRGLNSKLPSALSFDSFQGSSGGQTLESDKTIAVLSSRPDFSDFFQLFGRSDGPQTKATWSDDRDSLLISNHARSVIDMQSSYKYNGNQAGTVPT